MTTEAAVSIEQPRFDGPTALSINCSLKRSGELSHTGAPIERRAALMAEHGVEVELIRAADEDIATGAYPDMSEHGAASDAWPAMYERVLATKFLVLGGVIWLGDTSSV